MFAALQSLLLALVAASVHEQSTTLLKCVGVADY